MRTLVLTLISILLIPTTSFAYSDFSTSHPYYFTIQYLSEEGLISGYDDGTVRPDDLINRAELVKILVEGLNKNTNFEALNSSQLSNCFTDVSNEWFAKYVCFAQGEGWINGYPDGKFHPERAVNKAEAAKIILNAFQISPNDNVKDLYLDTDETDWYGPYLQAAVNKNLLEETLGGYFNPTKSRTRAEVSEMIARIMQIKYMGDPMYSEWIKAEFQTLFLINELRENNGVDQKLKLNPALTKSARSHSKDMAKNIGDLSHLGSDGSTSRQRIQYAGISGQFGSAENLGKGLISNSRNLYKTISDIHLNIFMQESDTECNHRTTILSSCLPFEEIGIGIYVKDNILYFTEDFLYFL